MNNETINELIQSLESAGELSIKERKYLDVMKWAVGVAGARDASLNAERVWEKTMMEVCGEDGPASVAAVIKQLAAENVGLKEDRDTLARYWIEDGGDKDCAMSYCEPTPSTDRIVAGIKADGVEAAIDHIAQTICPNHETVLKEFAAQLREGADK